LSACIIFFSAEARRVYVCLFFIIYFPSKVWRGTPLTRRGDRVGRSRWARCGRSRYERSRHGSKRASGSSPRAVAVQRGSALGCEGQISCGGRRWPWCKLWRGTCRLCTSCACARYCGRGCRSSQSSPHGTSSGFRSTCLRSRERTLGDSRCSQCRRSGLRTHAFGRCPPIPALTCSWFGLVWLVWVSLDWFGFPPPSCCIVSVLP
jgi:hypothetical protein